MTVSPLILFALAILLLLYATYQFAPTWGDRLRRHAPSVPRPSIHQRLLALLPASAVNGFDRVVAWQNAHTRARTVVAAGAWILALITVQAIGNQQPTKPQGLLLALASIMLALAMPVVPFIRRPARLPGIAQGLRLYAGLAGIGAGCLVAIPAAINGYESLDTLFFTGLLTYLAAAILVGVGLILVTGWRPGVALARQRAALHRHMPEVGIVILILAVGLALRLYGLGVYPPAQGYFIIDEPQVAGGAYNVLHFGMHPWSYPELLYSIALSFKLFGASLLTMRYPIVAAGFLALIVFYLLARSFFAWPVAAAGTALLAVSRLEISYSRLVLPSVTMMVVELIIFTLAVYAVRGRYTYPAYAVMGLLAGLGLYSHTSFRLALLLLGFFGIGWLLGEWRRAGPLLRAHAPGWALFLVVALLVALPYAGIVHNDPHAFTERLTSIMPLLFNQGTVADPGAILHANLQSLLGYFVGPGDGPAVNPPQTPMLDPITASLFLLGLGYALLRPRRRYILMALAWLMLTLLSGAVLTTDFHPERFVGYMPALYLLACMPIALFWHTIQGLQRPAWGIAVAGLVVALGLAGWVNAGTLVRQSQNVDVRQAFHSPELDMVLYFRAHGHEGSNYLLAGFPFPDRTTDYGWVAGDPTGNNAAELADLAPIHDPVDGRVVHVVIASPYPDGELAQGLRRVYPTAQLVSSAAPDGGSSYSAVTVSTHAIVAQEGLAVHCPASSAAVWSGSIYAPAGGVYALSANVSPGTHPHATLRLDGAPLQGPVHLDMGWHTLVITARGPSPSCTLMIRWTGPGGVGQVPSYLLRKTPAYGLLLQYFTAAGQAHPLGEPERVPFPFFYLPEPDNGGRPLGAAPGTPYRVRLTGIVAPGHAGTYAMDLYCTEGQATVFLDGRQVGAGQAPDGTPPSDTPLLLHLNGRAQTLRIAYSMPSTQQQVNASVALYDHPRAGARGFLPWSWMSPPP